MNNDKLKQISTLNYIDSWAKNVRTQALEMKKLFYLNFGTNWRDYSSKEGEIIYVLDEIINHISDGVDDMEL